MSSIYTGTSGFSYRDWKPRFYPKDLPAAKMLEHYASVLPMVEINNTFYRRPEKAHLEAWAARVPSTFRFVFKASRYFSAGPGLRNAHKPLAEFFALLSAVKDKLGPVLVQLPQHVKHDASLLRDFIAAIPEGRRVALELVDPSWKTDAAMDAMRSRDVAWCVTETDAAPLDPITTASWGYFRLRKARYDERALRAWARRLVEAKLDDAFVAFKHDDTGVAAKNAVTLFGLTNPKSASRPRRR